jgi:hypothetical protein
MLEFLIATGAAGAGFLRSRDFVARRRRYVEAVRTPAAPWVAAVGATALAAPVVMLLPIVGAGTALAFGAAVGVGTFAGVRRIVSNSYSD